MIILKNQLLMPIRIKIHISIKVVGMTKKDEEIQIPEMTPGMRSGEIPKFYLLQEYLFQDLCRDLYYHETDINSSEHFGVRGQSQYGVDLLAKHNNIETVDLVQCKAYQVVETGGIKKACKKFFDEIKHWDEYKISKFVLVFGCSIDETRFHQEIKDLEKQFKAKSITFEVWSAAKLRMKLECRPIIVGRYCSPRDYWLQEICGVDNKAPSAVVEQSSPSFQTNILVNNALLIQLESITKSLSDTKGKSFENQLDLWKQGKLNSTLEWLKEVKSNGWEHLPNELKSKILRFEASVKLDLDQSIEEVEFLANEAKKIFTEADDSRLRALIQYHKDNLDEAIKLMKDTTGVDNRNLLASFYLVKKDSKTAIDILLSLGESEINAESSRLLALANLTLKEMEKAEYFIDKALEMAPDWRGIKFAHGCIQYYKAVSPTVLPDRFSGWPESVEVIQLKTDINSQASLERACRIFTELASIEEREERKSCYQMWSAACWINMGDFTGEGRRLLESLVHNIFTSFFAVAWVLSRNIAIDLSKLVLVKDKEKVKDVSQIIVSAMVLMHTNSGQQAVNLLEAQKGIFVEKELEDIWKFWISQCYINTKKPEKALEICGDSISLNLDIIRILAYKFIDNQQKNKVSLALRFARKAYKKYKTAFWLQELCSLLYGEKKWGELARHSENLFLEAQTVHALHLALVALFNCRQYPKCLSLLETSEKILKDGKLNPEILGIKVLSLRMLGRFPIAVKEAELLVREFPTRKNLLNIFQLYAEKGDAAKMIVAGRELLGCKDLKDNESLKLSLNIMPHDFELSKTFFKRINFRNIKDHEVPPTLALSYKLGIEENEVLMQRMSKLAEKGAYGVKLVKTDDIKAMMNASSERIKNLNDLYRGGRLPIHGLLSGLNISIVDIYHRALDSNKGAKSSEQWATTLFFHGGRDFKVINGKLSEKTLRMDVTAFMNAVHFGYLEILEKNFKTLSLPKSLPLFLSMLKENYVHNQKSRAQANEEIVRLNQEKKIIVSEVDVSSPETEELMGQSLAKAMAWADTYKSVVVDFFPPSISLEKEADANLLQIIETRVVDFLSLADFLKKEGLITKNEYDESLNKLPKSNGFSGKGSLRKGQRILLPGIVPEVLAYAGLLQVCADNFQLYFDQDEIMRIEWERNSSQASVKVQAWIDNIQKSISEAVGEGNDELYLHPDQSAKKSLEMAMLEGFLAQAREEEIPVVDDRYVNSYSNVGSSFILSSLDILRNLKLTGSVSAEQYWEILLSMRASGVMYIRHEADEILHYLAGASISEGTLKENRELSILRRYYSGVFFKLKTCYQKPHSYEGMPNPLGEGAFMVGLSQMAHDLVLEVWKQNVESDRKIAESNWIMSNLFFTFTAVHYAAGTNVDEINMSANLSLSLSTLISRSIQLEISENRREYLEWVHEHIKHRTDRSPRLMEYVLKTLKNLFTATFSEKHADKEAIAVVFHKLLNDIPDSMRTDIESDTDFISKFGLKLNYFVNLNGFEFDANDFWKVVVKVLENKQEKLKERSKDQEFSLKLLDDGAIQFLGEENISFNISLPEFDFLESEVDLNRLFVPSKLFDTSNFEVVRLKEEYKKLESVSEKVNFLNPWTTNSLAIFYDRLNFKIGNTKTISFPELVPEDSEFIFRSYRLNSSSVYSLEEDLSLSLQDLLNTGVEAALNRFLSLPIEIPIHLIAKVSTLGAEEKRKLFKDTIRFSGSPVSRIQLAKLLLSQTVNPELGRLASRILRRITSPQGRDELKAYLSLLKWVYGQLSFKSIRGDLLHLIAWGHTSNLFAILQANKVELKWIETQFASRAARAGLDLFKTPKIYLDCLFPGNLTTESLLVKFCNYATAGNSSLTQKLYLSKNLENICISNDVKRTLSLSMLSLQKTHDNLTDSFIGWNSVKYISELFPLEANVFMDETTMVAQLLEWSANEIKIDQLVYFSLFIDSYFRLAETEKLARLFLTRVDFETCFNVNPMSTLYGIRGIAEYAYRMTAVEVSEQLFEKLKGFTKLFSTTLKYSPEHLDLIAETILEVTFLTSSAIGRSKTEGVEAFSDRLNMICMEWPLLFTELRDVLEALVQHSTPVEERYLWDILNRSRSI